MAATMATTMAVLNTKCLTMNTNKTPNTFSQKPTSKPISLFSLQNLPKGLTSKTQTSLPLITAPALAGAIFATLGSMDSAIAAQQITDIAANGDNRGLALLLPIVPAIGWVLFNILQPALNQVNKMRSEKAIMIGLGLTGLMMSSPEAQAAAAANDGSDNRGTLLLIVVLPAIGWVLFNILQPALNQLNKMRSQ